MKKTSRLVATLLALCLMLTACSSSYTSPATSPQAKLDPSDIDGMIGDSPVTATLLQGVPSGLWYMISNGIAECLNTSYKGSILHITPGVPVANAIRLSAGETDFAMLHNNLAYEAITGTGMFDQKHENIAGVASFYPSQSHLILDKRFGVSSLQEIIDKKLKLSIAVGSFEGSGHMAFLRLMEAYGITSDDMEGWGVKFHYVNVDKIAQMFADGTLDAMFFVASVPTPGIVEVSVNRELAIINIGQQAIDFVCEKYGYSQGQIPKGSYNFVDRDIAAFSSVTMLGANKDLSVEAVYKMTKAIGDNLDYMRIIHGALNDLSLESMTKYMMVPMHPGAEMYYREMGVLD